MAEAILRQRATWRFCAFSAGSHPTGRVNPLALEALSLRGYSTEDLFSKSWSRFTAPDAPQLDLVVTVCGKAAVEPQPQWPGHPPQVFWSFPSPGSVQGSDAAVRAVFSGVCEQIEAAIGRLLDTPLDQLGAAEALARLAALGPR